MHESISGACDWLLHQLSYRSLYSILNHVYKCVWLWVHMCMWMQVPAETDSLEPMEPELPVVLSCQMLGPSLNPLEEQYALLTTGPSLPSLQLCFFWYLDNQMPGLEDSLVNFRSELPSLSFSIKTECWGIEFTLLFIHSWKSLRI